MARIKVGTAPMDASSNCCGECRADVSQARKFQGTHHSITLVVCDYCAAISVRDGPRWRYLKTEEWVPIVLEPDGFELLAYQVATARRIKESNRIRHVRHSG